MGAMTDHPLVAEATQADLALRIKAGDHLAEEELSCWLAARVFAMVLARTRDRELAKDLCQDVMIAAIEALRKGQLRDPGRLAGFVQGIARNTVNNYLRASGRIRPHAPLTDVPSEPADERAGDALEDIRREEIVREAMGQLAPGDREILQMTFVDELKPGDIARRLGLSPEAARQRKFRALKRIEDYIRSVTKRES